MRVCTFLVDTQADISVIRNSSILGDIFINRNDIIRIKGVTQDSLNSLGTVELILHIDNDEMAHEFHVVPDEFNIDCDGIIGKDFLLQYRCKVDYETMTFTISNKYRNILRIMNGPDEKTMVIPPRCEIVKKFEIEMDQECVVDQMIMAPGVYTARTIVNPDNAYIRVINTTNEPQKIERTIRKVEPLQNFNIFNADGVEKDAKRIEHLKKIVQKNLPELYRSKLNELIEQFADVFALPEDKMSTNNFYTQKFRTVQGISIEV